MCQVVPVHLLQTLKVLTDFLSLRSLDDTLQTKSTISTLSNEIEISSNENTVSNESMQLNPSSISFNTENSITDSSDTSNDTFVSSNIPFEMSTPVTSCTSKTLKPILITSKKQNIDSEIQTVLLDIIKEPIPHIDAIDSLKTLGEALRRLSYRKRTLTPDLQ